MVTKSTITRLMALNNESSRHIVVIGDALIDEWIHGVMLPSQDNCNKFVEHYRIVSPGGAANVVNCLSYWNVTTKLFAQADRGTKTRYVCDDNIVFRVDNDVFASPTEETEREILSTIYSANAVILSDYAKGFLHREFIANIISLCKANRVPCVVDAKHSPEFYSGAIIKGNNEWAEKYSASGPNTIVTRGAENPIVNNCVVSMYSPLVKCVNHVGAGDCFTAHLALALSHGFSLRDAAVIAHRAGSVYVQHHHNRPPRPNELLNMSIDLVYDI